MTATAVSPAMPFSVVDELSCYHDHRAEPNTVHLEAALSGHLDQAALRSAVTAMLATTPRARARRAAPGRLARRYRWEFPAAPDHDPVAVTSWRDHAELATARAGFIAAAPALDHAPAFRLLLAVGPDQDCLILSAHHAAFDGQSCLELIRQICHNYAHPAGASRQGPAGRAPDCQDLAGSSQSAAPGETARSAQARRTRTFAVTRIAADRADQAAAGQDGYGCVLLPPLDASVIRAAGSRHDATVNDLLVCALALAIGSWNASHHKPAGQIKITMPVSGRSPDAQAELGNLSRLAVVRVAWPGDPDHRASAGLLRHIAAQTRQAKEHTDREVDPVSRALTTSLLPVTVKRALLRGLLRTAGRFTIDTSLVSNLGVIEQAPRFGPVTATAMAFSTSAHMPRGLSAGVITVGSQLQICLRYRRALLSDSAAKEFASHYLGALSRTTG